VATQHCRHFEKDDLPNPQQAVCHLFMALVYKDQMYMQLKNTNSTQSQIN